MNGNYGQDATSDDDSEGSVQPAKRVRLTSSVTSTTSNGTGDDFDQEQDDLHVPTDDDNGYETASTLSAANSQTSMNMTQGSQSSGGVGHRIMGMYGFVPGMGLGKHGQGIKAPVEASTQKGRRGLGLVLDNVEVAIEQWDPSMEHVSAQEDVSWLYNRHVEGDTPTKECLSAWAKWGPRKRTIDDETQFCEPDILKHVLSGKTVFDKMSPEELRKARTRCNPFELIKGVFFLNRAAMKMANMDMVFDFMFTKPKDMKGNRVNQGDLLYFADVCAGPGGFSEYVLFRRRWKAKGFGFTLKSENDFKLSEFYAGPPETFEPNYGERNDGDVFVPNNISSFHNFVMEGTDNMGVHFMMADGGFSADGRENIQEIISKQLYLCQCIVALLIVRPGGHFVVKLFDVFTPFSVGLVYLMHRAFHQISIHKPNTSRPANSERYLICKWKRNDTEELVSHLFNINKELHEKGGSCNDSLHPDINELVPIDVLHDDQAFFDYIVTSNNRLGEQQIVALGKIAAYCENSDLVELRQNDLRKECLKLWQIEDKARKAIPSIRDQDIVSKLFELHKGASLSYMEKRPEPLTPKMLTQTFNICDWRCYLLASSDSTLDTFLQPTFYLGLGSKNVFRLVPPGRWVKTENIELPPGTLVYGQTMCVMRGDFKSLTRSISFSILDGLFIDGQDIRHLHVKGRWQQCQLLAKALNKTSPSPMLYPITVTPFVSLENLKDVIALLQLRSAKNNSKFLGYPLDKSASGGRCFKPDGVLLVNGTSDHWTRNWSRSNHAFYFHCSVDNRKIFENKPCEETFAHFEACYSRRLIWSWPEGKLPLHSSNPNILQANHLWKFIEGRLRETRA